MWQLPWDGASNPWLVVTAVVGGRRPEIPPPKELPGNSADFPGLDAYIALINKCWAQDPADRPGFQEIINDLRCAPGHNSLQMFHVLLFGALPSSPADRPGFQEIINDLSCAPLPCLFPACSLLFWVRLYPPHLPTG